MTEAEVLLETIAVPVGTLYQRLQAVDIQLRNYKRVISSSSPTAVRLVERDLNSVVEHAKMALSDVRAACEAIDAA